MARAKSLIQDSRKPRYASSSMKQSLLAGGDLASTYRRSCRCFNLRRGDLWQAHPSLPSSFHATTINSPEGAEIFVPFRGKWACSCAAAWIRENSDSWAPLAADSDERPHCALFPTLGALGARRNQKTGYDKKTRQGIRAVVTSWYGPHFRRCP